ncbi:DMT family transporter [Ideonella sp. 4Y11]|uniref:DMT family transporter n=1 Tax=Ideonella aquatica TaxID=2824119 RepID=A0A940YKJ1_9BURK|nr:DMT family transporter [Ideonella aquatica]MBQ0961224.1 DMT family transporter [Ideonella aquatica]
MPSSVLFVVCVLIWGTTWFAILYQLDAIAPGAGVALRFALAALAMILWALWRGERLRFAASLHRWFALQGLAGFALAYWGVYEAERHVVTGLVAVGYAASPLLNMVLARWTLGTPLSRRVGWGGVAGVGGVAMIFWHEFARLSASPAVLTGAALTAAAVLMSSVSSLCAAHYHRQQVSGPAPLAWAMGYGAAFMTALSLASGELWTLRWSPAFGWSLAYLVLAGSVLAFGCYYALMQRIGPARAAYVGVSTPVVAMSVSYVAEGYRPDGLAMAGALLAVAGNVWALWPQKTVTPA